MVFGQETQISNLAHLSDLREDELNHPSQMTFFTDLVEFRFLQYAILAGLLSSLLAGSVGTFVVIRRSTYVAGAVSHSALGGIGLAKYLQVQLHWQWLDPLWGAIVSALLTSAIVAWVRTSEQ